MFAPRPVIQKSEGKPGNEASTHTRTYAHTHTHTHTQKERGLESE